MLRRSIKVMAAAAVFGISPALLPAQSPLDGVGAQLESNASSNAQVKPNASAPKAPLEGVQKQNGADAKLDSKTKLKSQSKLDSDKNLDSKLDAESKTKARGNVKTPGLTPPNTTRNPVDTARKAKPADGAIRKGLPQNRDMKNNGREGVDRMRGAGAKMQKRLRNTPLPPDGKRQTFQGQGKFEIDDMVRQGTAHLDIDDATRSRYRHHNGHWWYKTENGQWLIDNNGQWEPFDPVSYREPNRPMNQEYYLDQGQADGDFQTYSDDGYYYDDSDYYYDNNYGIRNYGNRGYNRGNGYSGNRYYNNNRNGYGRFDGRNDRGNGNRGHYNDRDRYNNSGRRSSGYRGRMNQDRRQGAAIGAEIGGSIGGRRGAAIGAGIGAEIAD
ncbi:hypothetical protein [uncultured Gimesia sp.]|uniref:hypothetical protein n=1 Tax=uncultured Gimesia sp. TaxID=1678688 RepID=UPI0030DCDFFF